MNKKELKKRIRELIMNDEIENTLLTTTRELFNNERRAYFYIDDEGKITVNEHDVYMEDSIFKDVIDFDYYYENDFIKEYKISDYIDELNLSSLTKNDYNDFYKCEKNYIGRCFKEICENYAEEIKDELERIIECDEL